MGASYAVEDPYSPVNISEWVKIPTTVQAAFSDNSVLPERHVIPKRPWREGSYETLRNHPRRVREWYARMRHRQFPADVRSLIG
jgi:hypothetical protein